MIRNEKSEKQNRFIFFGSSMKREMLLLLQFNFADFAMYNWNKFTLRFALLRCALSIAVANREFLLFSYRFCFASY